MVIAGLAPGDSGVSSMVIARCAVLIKSCLLIN